MKKLSLLSAILLFNQIILIAQEWKWYNSGNSGLSTSNVRSLALNDSGFLFAGTNYGVYSFKNDTWKTVNLGNLSTPATLKIWTKSNNLWVGTEYNGLWGLANGTWKNYDPNTSGNGIVGFGIDTHDSIFRLDKFGDFDVWTGTNWKQISSFFSQPNNLYVDSFSNVWLLSNNAGLTRYKDGILKSWGSNYNPTDPKFIPAGSLFDMIQDTFGLYWIASNSGLIKFDGTNFQLITTANSDISSNRLRCLAIDKNRNLWVGTWDAGISVWDGLNWRKYDMSNSPLMSNIINDIVIDSSNRVWIANGFNEFTSPNNGQGVFLLNEKADLSNGRLPNVPGEFKSKVISVNEVELSWKDNSDNESQFLIERSDGNDLNFKQIKGVANNTVKFSDYTVNGNTFYYYRVRAVNSKGYSQYSEIIKVQPKYCTVNKSDYSAYAIAKRVVFGNINNNPFNCRNGYYDYLDQATNVYQGQTLTLYLSVDRCSVTTDPIIGCSVYIDWNSDGDFQDSKELIFSKTTIDGKEDFQIPVTVPDFVIPGTVARLRIRCEDDVYSGTTAISPCGYAEETQDYSVNIVAVSANSAPSDISAYNITSRVQYLHWQDNASSETEYIIQKSTDSISFNRVFSLPPNSISFKDGELQPDTKYYYRVCAKVGIDTFRSKIFSSATLSADLVRQWTGDAATTKGFNIGAFWNDFDNDGKCDLYTTGNDVLFYNKNSILTNSKISLGVGATGVWGDYDNDGNDDIFLTDYIYGAGGSTANLFKNNGDGTFVLMQPSFTIDGRINNAVWTDYNNDGFLDLYISYLDLRYGKLYRNNRNQTFSFAEKFDNTSGYASFADYDNDGDDDLIVVGGGSKNVVFKKTDSTFVRDNNTSLSFYTENCRGVSWADYDNDGDIDLFVPASVNDYSSLYVNYGQGSFSRTMLSTSLNANSYGSAWADYDNDGWQDLFVSRFSKTNKLFRNRVAYFEELPPTVFSSENYSSFPYDEMPSMGCAWADYDNDGFLDLYVAVNNGFDSRLYKNGGNNYNWISVLLKGTVSNKNAIGAKVKIIINGVSQYRWVQSGSGFSAQNSPTLEFGLNNAETVDSLIVYWPSGNVQTLTNVAKNQFLTITEKKSVTDGNNVVPKDFKVFPNPGKREVFIKLNNNQVIKSSFATITDFNGKEGKYQLNILGNGLYSIRINTLQPGIYWLRIVESGYEINEKILVIK